MKKWTKKEYVNMWVTILRGYAEDVHDTHPMISSGICDSLDDELDQVFVAFCPNEIVGLSENWHHKSMSISFPVPSPYWFSDPYRSFAEGVHFERMWEGDYGQSRRDLADFLADELERMVL